MYGRGAALCEASEFLAPKRARGAWCGAYALGTLTLARFRAHPRGPEASLRVFYQASMSILLDIIEQTE